MHLADGTLTGLIGNNNSADLEIGSRENGSDVLIRSPNIAAAIQTLGLFDPDGTTIIAGGTGARLSSSGKNVGFYGTTPVALQTVTGIRDPDSTIVQTNLLIALDALGLIVDGTTP